MRELKFRMWNKFRPEMVYATNNHYISFNGFVYWQFGFDSVTPLDPDEYILMQYTGLKDKNGREIYEGDIAVKEGFNHVVGVITYQAPDHNLVSIKSGMAHSLHVGELEVIGNIYESPELIHEPTTKEGE